MTALATLRCYLTVRYFTCNNSTPLHNTITLLHLTLPRVALCCVVSLYIVIYTLLYFMSRYISLPSSTLNWVNRITLSYVMSLVTFCYVTSRYLMSWITLCYVTLRYELSNIMLRYVMSWVTFCYVELRYELNYVMLRYVMNWVTLCYVTLWV